MNPQTPEEQLSALLDGELDADRSKFLLRRLQHDDALADTLGRWQLAGDVLRGQGSAAASDSFAARLSARLAAEAPPAMQADEPDAVPQVAQKPAAANAQAAVNPGRWRYFAGGALAASLAFAAFIGLRAPEANQPAAITTAQQAAPQAAETAEVRVAEATPPVVEAAAEPVMPEPQVQAVVQASPRPARSRSQSRTATATAAAAVQREPVQLAQQASDASQDPFSPPQARPAWPRAVVPGSGSSTFNVRLDGEPSYSPFQPHTQNNQD